MKITDKDSRHEILDINISEKHIFLLRKGPSITDGFKIWFVNYRGWLNTDCCMG